MSHPTAGDAALYKICPRHSWAEALQTGQLPVSRDDARDGYIHLSIAQQLRGTLERHFAAQPDLVLLVIPSARLPEGALRWELSARGQPFPHLYAQLHAELVEQVLELPLDGERRHVLPQGL